MATKTKARTKTRPTNFPPRTPAFLREKVERGDPLTVSEKVRLDLPITAEDAALVRELEVLDTFEAAVFLGRSARWVEKEGHGKRKLPPPTRPPDSNSLTWRRADLERTLEAWSQGLDWDAIPEPRRPRQRSKAVA